MPEFQRPFVWDENDVAEMLRTVVSDWPSGNILLIGSQELIGRFELTAIRGGPEIEDPATVKMLVLDGQQRLTSVFQALTNNVQIGDPVAKEFVFFVDMDLVHQQDGLDEDAVKWRKREEFPGEQEAADKLWAAFHVLYSEKAFDTWLDQVPQRLRSRMEQLYGDRLWPIRSYKFPANTLPLDLEFRSLVRIFDKLNRLGQELKTFDLLVALLLPEGFQLRQRADAANEVFAAIGNGCSINAIEIAKLIALEEHLREVKAEEPIVVGGVRESDVLDLVDRDSSLISSQWDGAVQRYSEALRFLNERCGAITSNLTAQSALILALAVGLVTEGHREGFDDDLTRWVWASYFAQAYAQGVNTRAVSDAEELRKWATDSEATPCGPTYVGDSARARPRTPSGQPEGQQTL